MSHIPGNIQNKIGVNLHNKNGHPIKIIKDLIFKYFDGLLDYKFHKFDDLSPYVNVIHNFDALQIPADHPTRRTTDTYYVSSDVVLRTHMTCHQYQFLKDGLTGYLAAGDVYRKDEINCTHYPIFHQIDGGYLVDTSINPEDDLKKILSGLIEYLFPKCEYRFNSDYFPFTNPSFEIEVMFNGKWLEVLGCGVIHEKILAQHEISKKGWAFGLGLERLAMILFNIPDIRLFWSADERFTKQFVDEKITKFKPYPTLKSVSRDVSFWINNDEILIDSVEDSFTWKNINNFYEWIRELCDNSIENVELIDKFYHKKHKKYSMTFRLHITPPESEYDTMLDSANLTKYANMIMMQIAEKLKSMNYDIR